MFFIIAFEVHHHQESYISRCCCFLFAYFLSFYRFMYLVFVFIPLMIIIIVDFFLFLAFALFFTFSTLSVSHFLCDRRINEQVLTFNCTFVLLFSQLFPLSIQCKYLLRVHSSSRTFSHFSRKNS